MPAVKKLKPMHRGDPVATRLCTLVNEHFEGNLSVAAVAIGVDYDQLRRSCLGQFIRGAPLPLVLAVADHFHLTVDSLIGRNDT